MAGDDDDVNNEDDDNDEHILSYEDGDIVYDSNGGSVVPDVGKKGDHPGLEPSKQPGTMTASEATPHYHTLPPRYRKHTPC